MTPASAVSSTLPSASSEPDLSGAVGGRAIDELAVDRLALARRALVEANEAAGVVATRTTPDGSTYGRRGPIVTGIESIDRMLGGGLPRGRVVEITGARSSGRLSLTLALLARAVRTGEPSALIDVADALDPRALDPDVRPRILWVRPRDVLTALKCMDLLLDAGGFGLVALYLVGVRDLGRSTGRATAKQGVGSAAWVRIAQRAEQARSCVVVTLDARSAHAPGAFAHASLAVERRGVVWRRKELLESLRSEVVVARGRSGIAPGTSGDVTFMTG